MLSLSTERKYEVTIIDIGATHAPPATETAKLEVQKARQSVAEKLNAIATEFKLEFQRE